MGKRLLSAVPQTDRLEKRLRRAKPICSCSSPRPAFLTAQSSFSWYEEDVWTQIAKFLDGRSLVMLALTSRWFHRLIMEDSIWKFVCLRDLQVPAPEHVAFKWVNLYTSAFDGSHSYLFHQQEKHIDWMRIGAFFLESSEALLTERLSSPEKIPKEDTIEEILQSCGCCVFDNVKSGIWIADLQLVRCPVCDLHTCDEIRSYLENLVLYRDSESYLSSSEVLVAGMFAFLSKGTMQILDARHIELFLCEEFQDGSWEYELIGSHDVKKRVNGASAALFDLKHLKDPSSCAVFNLDSWMGKPSDWQPKATITLHAVAVNTNLQANEGLHVKYQAMRAGADGEVVSIRISQQLL